MSTPSGTTVAEQGELTGASEASPQDQSRRDAPSEDTAKKEETDKKDETAKQDETDRKEDGGKPAAASATQLAVLLLIFLVIYVSPVLLTIAVIITRYRYSINSIFDATLPVTDMLVYIAANKKDIFGLIHQLIVPVLAALAAFNVEKVRQGKNASWIFAVPASFLAAAVVISIVFQFLTDLPEAQIKLVRDYFIDLSQNLAVYVFMLVGLKFSAR